MRIPKLNRTAGLSIALIALIQTSTHQAESAENPDIERLVSVADDYYFGRGAKQSYIDALNLYKEAASLGSVSAPHYIGYMYYEGVGVEKDLDAARTWFQQAAKQGHAPAQYSLGKIYEYGTGVSVDYKKAIAWYLKASDQGYHLAQRQLGLLFTKGEGMQQNLAWGALYSAMAANKGDPIADLNLERILPHLPMLVTSRNSTRLFSGPGIDSVSLGELEEGTKLYQLDAPQSNWIVVYVPMLKRIAQVQTHSVYPASKFSYGYAGRL